MSDEMLVYYEGAGAWCRASSDQYDQVTYQQLSSPHYLNGIFKLSDSARKGIEDNGSIEVTYLLPCLNNHKNAAVTPSGEDSNLLIFQLYAGGNELSEKVYHKSDVLNLKSSTPIVAAKNKITQERLKKMVKHLETLEETAKTNGINFDKKKMECSKKELHQWLKEKPGSHFNIAELTFRDTWKLAKDYGLCSPAKARDDFFKKIQG